MLLSGRRRPCHFNGNRLYFAPGYEAKLAEVGLSQGSRWDRFTCENVVTSSKGTTVYRITLSDGEVVYYKCYLFFAASWRFFLRASKPAVENFGYKELAKLGIPTAEPVVVGEIRRYGLLLAACIVTKEIPETVSLKDYAISEWRFLPSEFKREARLKISEIICRDIQIMHRAGFYHFDAKWRNILLRRSSSGQIEGIWWIDSPRARKLSVWGSSHGKVCDLSALCRMALSFLTRSQRLRFLFVYCGPNVPRKEVKNLAIKVSKHLQRHPPKLIQFKT